MLDKSVFPYFFSPSNTQPPSPQRYASDTEVNYQREQEQPKNDATWNWGRLPEVKLSSFKLIQTV